MRTIVLTILSLTALITACDDGVEFVRDLGERPQLTLLDSDINEVNEINDRLKFPVTSIKDEIQVSYDFNVRSEGEVVALVFDIIGNGKIVIKEDTLSTNTVDYNGELTTITFVPTEIGTSSIDLTVISNLGLSSEGKNISLDVFNNEPPEASFLIIERGINSNLEYDLDASGSFDNDASFGGFISLYKWRIGEFEFSTTDAIVSWSFGAPGNYEIALIVEDSDGEESEEVVQVVSIN
ncbi:MAG: PKD domain-containing protein [Bacteroidota bacterium]